HRGLQRLSYARLREMLFTSNTTPRQGIALGADSLRFFSRPEWRRDSIVFIPFIANNIPASPTSEEVDAIRRAVSYNRDVFQSIAATWAATLPASAGTKEALAVSLEMRGDPAAIDTLRSARRLTSDPNHRVRLASQEALLLFKFGFPNDHAALRRVRVESDSLLSIKAPASLESARALSSLAALTGKCAAVAELKRRIAQPRSDVVDAPRQVVAEWDAVEAKAALGCQSTRTSSFVEVNASIWSAQVKGAAAQRRAAAPLVLGRAVLLTFPLDSAWVARLSSPRSGGVLQAAHAILVGEHEAARRHLEISLTALLPGEITPDAIYPRARLWLMLADTSTSVQLLDRVLRDVRFLSPGLLDSPVQIGALVRVAMLRAEIAANRGDSQKAALLSTAVMDLWSGADPDLSPSLRAVSRFARQ
ncbi:MAG TPA: hypothetical protein VHE78_14175, partial [Gemmatimonadaceae bacterium]|nr:hypothetical protein [Gemmatimonadaceae bacterium]